MVPYSTCRAASRPVQVGEVGEEAEGRPAQVLTELPVASLVQVRPCKNCIFVCSLKTIKNPNSVRCVKKN